MLPPYLQVLLLDHISVIHIGREQRLVGYQGGNVTGILGSNCSRPIMETGSIMHCSVDALVIYPLRYRRRASYTRRELRSTHDS